MKKKDWLKIGIFAIIAFLVVAFFASFLQVNNAKDTCGIYGYYKEPEDSLDVVLIGTSGVYTAFYCPLAYEKHGFTSYPISTSAMTAPLVKYAVKMAEERHDPQLYVIDTWSFAYDDQYDESNLRKLIDSIQSKDIKEEAIEEIVPEELKESFKYPFLKYHANWSNPVTCIKAFVDRIAQDIKGYTVTKGYATQTTRIKAAKTENKYNIEKDGFELLEDLLEYLKDEGIENVLFIRGIEMGEYKTDETYDRMIGMIEEAGFDFYNANADKDIMGIDENHDYYNVNHMNVFGTEKFTEYFSEYIIDHYDIKIDHREDVKKEWDYCASNNDSILTKLKEDTENKQDRYLYMQPDFAIK